MRRLLMLEEQKAWKREAGFVYIETAAEMDAQRFRTSLVSETFLYRNMFDPRLPRTPDEFKLEMRVDVERLRMEIALSQPAPRSQCDPSLRRLPAIGTGLGELGVSRAETSTDKEENTPLEPSVDGFLRLNCRSPEQECILLQPDVGVDDEEETTGTLRQAAAREEFARPTRSGSGKGRQLGQPCKASSSTGEDQQ